MKKTILFFLGLIISLLMHASVTQTADVTDAGTLYTLVTSYKADVTDLTVTGTIDARDFVTIRDSMPNLVNLDLSGSSIAAYQGTAQSPGSDTYQISGWGYIENMIPYWAFVHETSSTTVTGGSTTLKSIILPNTCTWIGYGGFYGCTALNSVTLPESLTIIGGKAFYNCTSLSAISIPSAVTSIRDAAFFNCSALAAITVNNSTPPSFSGSNNLYGVNQNCIVYVPSVAVTTYQATSIWNTLTIRSINNSLSFDGNGNYVDLGPLEPTDNFSNGFSFMCWVKFNSFDDWSRIFDFGNGLNSDNILAGVHTDGSLSFDVFSGSNATPLTTQAILSTGTWTHIAFTVNASGLQSIYINGKIVATGTYNSPENISRTIGYLGKSEWTGDPFLNGQMDEVSIWNKTLLATDIQNYLITNVKGNESELFRYFKFDEGIANNDNTVITSLVDSSSIHVNGTINNFVLNGTTSNWVEGYVPSILYVLNNTVSLQADKGSNEVISVITAATWTASSNQTWLTVSPTNGTGSSSIIVTATENLSKPRTATVTLSSNGQVIQTITVTQAAGISYRGDLPAITLSDNMDETAPFIDQASNFINSNGHNQYLRFIPTTNGTYTFSSASSSDPYGELTDVYGNSLTGNDDGYGDNGWQFSFSYTLTAGETYYILLYNCEGDNYAITLNISGGDLLSCIYTGIGNWDEVANWNIGSIPGIYNNVTIDGDVTIDHDLSVSNITILPNASMSIDNGVTVKYVDLTLVNDETGSASLISDNTKMPATVSKYLKAGHNSYISSPMTTSKSNVVKVVGTDKLWNYDEKASSWNEITDGTTTLDSTSGYVANKTTDGNIYFSEGALNTGNYSNRLSNSGTNSKSGFNLVGNPYPSYLIWDLVNIANIDSSIWFRKQTAENAYVFDTYNSKTGIGTHNYGGSDVTGIIPPMQAFWVHVKSSPDGIIALNNTMRYNHNAYYALKADANSNDVIRLLVANGKNTDEAIIVFNSNASNGYDAWDSQKMFNESVNVPQIYTTVGDEKVVINGLESTTSNSIIPLGFKTAKAGTFTISATEINGVDVVVLEDKLLNKTQDLTGSASYTFTSDNVDNSNRFAIRLKANSVTDVPNVLESTIVIAAQNQSIVVTTSETTGTINVYDLLGRIVETKAIEGTKTVIESSVGVYFVKVQTATKNETKKLIIE